LANRAYYSLTFGFQNNYLNFKFQKMKQIAMLFGILFFFSIANGQITKGSFVVGGQANKTNTTTEYLYSDGFSTSHSSLSNNVLVFSIGRAYKDNDVYGFSVGFLPNSGTSSIYLGGSASTTNQSNYSANIYNRKLIVSQTF